MATEMTYDDILDQSFDDLQDDKVLPVGRWVMRLRNAHFMEPRGEGGNARILFFYHPVEPTDDVDSKALEALGEGYDWSENQIVFTSWIDGNRAWRDVFSHLRKHAGVDFDAGTIREVLKKGVKGSEVTAELGEETYENQFGELVLQNTASNFRPME